MKDGQVLVYLYEYWDSAQSTRKVSDVYATILAIRDGLGLPVYDSGIWVSLEDVQGGIYRPNRHVAPKV